MTLFEIGEELRALDALLDETGGELTPETESVVEEFFRELQSDQANKLNGYCHYLKKLESEAAVARATADQFRQKVAVRENAALRLKDRLKEFMIATGQKKAVTTEGWEIAVVNNGGKQPMDLDATAPIPKEFMVQPPPVADKDLIRAALEGGAKLPFARLKERGQQLRIK